jgi:glutamate N-acetyltransferase / amino-acid N-acetyltransferase
LSALPEGFVAWTGHVGLRDEGDDLAVVASTRPCASAGVFTKSRFAGPSVTLSRPRARAGTARVFVVVARNANVANGPQGARDASEVADAVAGRVGIPAEEVLIASTGVIGRPYPMDSIRRSLTSLPVFPDGFGADAVAVARAMMTTDTVPKVAGQTVGSARVVGVAKGVGMIEPNMATMLALVLTDAEIPKPALGEMWKRAVDETFNCLSVDTDTSTSDTAVVLANGAAGPVGEAALSLALRQVCLDLTLQLARDGEGATKLLSVTCRAARDRDQARRVAKAVVNSPLVKTAVHGADPN